MKSQTFFEGIAGMNLGKIAVLCIALYLAIALPLHFLNSLAVEKCSNACSEEGFDSVVSATGLSQEIQCRCFDTYARLEKFVTIGAA